MIKIGKSYFKRSAIMAIAPASLTDENRYIVALTSGELINVTATEAEVAAAVESIESDLCRLADILMEDPEPEDEKPAPACKTLDGDMTWD